MKFSERIGKKEMKVNIQIDSIDIELRNGLWNIISLHFIESMCRQTWLVDSSFNNTIGAIWFSFFKEPIDEIPGHTDTIKSQFRKRFFSWDYLQVYDFIDFIASMKNTPYSQDRLTNDFNVVLERELSAYRFVNNQLVQITSEQEIGEIEEAILKSSKYSSVKTHLNSALSLLSDRKNPDYRNSIKESISAVESICKIFTKNEKATLGETLNKLEKDSGLHPALKKSFSSLYGYTSDDAGIRHALTENDREIDFHEAKFILVTCSAFTNFLISKMKL